MTFTRLKQYLHQRRRMRQKAAIAAHRSYLEAVHSRRFPGTETERFMLLWCELAEICGLSPSTLKEDFEIASLRPPKSWFSFDDRLDDLDYWVLTESRALAPPRPKPETIGALLDYLLSAHTQDGGIGIQTDEE